MRVAPLVGAWIEIEIRGGAVQDRSVAPLVGAWIEIDAAETLDNGLFSRSPRGSVD